MEGMGSLWALIFSGIFLIPLAIAFFYFLIGLRSCFIGKRERNKAKIIGGYNTMFGSLMAIVFILFLWKILVWDRYMYTPE